MHVALMGDGRAIYAGQVERLKRAGLWDVADTIRVCTVGPGDLSIARGSTLEFHDENLGLYEFPTLEAIRQFSILNPGYFVLYLHTKGASWPGAPGRAAWRSAMEDVLVDRWGQCVRTMHKYRHRTLGVMKIRASLGTHYSGNFWWARSNYLAKLRPLKLDGTHPRLYAERWVCSDPGPHRCMRSEKRIASDYAVMDRERGHSQMRA